MEFWVAISGYIGVYEISSRGRVKRLTGEHAGCVLTPKPQRKGYVGVVLCRNGKKKRHLIHRLVAFAFLGAPPNDEYEVNHRNAVKDDNRAENLEWLLPKQNVEHAMNLGLVGGTPMPGSLNGRAKLNEADVREIRSLRGLVGARKLAARFRVSRSAIQFIHQGKHWRPAEWPEDLRVREEPR